MCACVHGACTVGAGEIGNSDHLAVYKQPYLYSPDVDASVIAKSCMCMPNWLNNLEPVTSH